MKTTLWIVMIVFVSLIAAGQVPTPPGTVTGVVRDSSGAGIPGVTVTAKGPGGTASALTNEYGEYRLTLPEGTYEITGALSGFVGTPATVSVNSGQIVQAPLSMQVAVQPPVYPAPLTPFEDYRITANSQTTNGAIISYRGNVRMITNTTELRADELDFNTVTLSADVRGNVSVRVVAARARVIPLNHR